MCCTVLVCVYGWVMSMTKPREGVDITLSLLSCTNDLGTFLWGFCWRRRWGLGDLSPHV